MVYVSSPVQVKEQLLASARITRKYTILRPFIFPVGIIKRSSDTIDFSAHLSDTRGYIFRLTGIEQLMKQIAATDQMAESLDSQASTPTAPLRYRLSHFLVAKDMAIYHKYSQIEYPDVVVNDAV